MNKQIFPSSIEGLEKHDSLNATPFTTVEEVWFWYCAAQLRRAEGGYLRSKNERGIERPCEPNDIYIVLRRLHQSRVLRRDHLYVMRYYGMRFRVPDPYRKRQAHAAWIWREAMAILESSLVAKGIVCPQPFVTSHTTAQMPEVRL